MESRETLESVIPNTLLYPQPIPVHLNPNPYRSTTIPHAVYSNVIEDIQQQQYVFEILWNKAMPAEQRIREIEEWNRTC